MQVATLTGAEFEDRLSRFLFERSEEARAVRVGEKETSEQAAIVARYEDLFTRGQLETLSAEEEGAEEQDRERLYRLREACAGGIVVRELAARSDRLENAFLAERIAYEGEELPLRAAQARLALLDDYAARERLGALTGDASARFNGDRLELIAAAEALDAELSDDPDPVRRSAERKDIDLHRLETALATAADKQAAAFERLRGRWLDAILGSEREPEPTSYHVAYLRRLSPLADVYTKERAVAVCLDTLARLGFDLAAEKRIRLDLDDRPQKSPRACVIASDPPNVVHLITRAQGGLHDYQSFLHEAGHALHYAGVEPTLPYTFRRLARDHALTEIYSFLLESVTREAGWHRDHFGLAPAEAEDRAEATLFLDILLFRRYAAKLAYELELWSDFGNAPAYATTYADALRAATGFRYRPDAYLADMDDGFYSADYLRAWIRTAQLRAYLRDAVGADWWQSPETGTFLRKLFSEGTRPSSEAVAEQIGFGPLDTGPLLDEHSSR
jgi:hypothetical protein